MLYSTVELEATWSITSLVVVGNEQSKESLAAISQQCRFHSDLEDRGPKTGCFLEGNGTGTFNFPSCCILVMQYFTVGMEVWECSHHIPPHCRAINYYFFYFKCWNASLLVKGHSSYSCKALGLKTESEILWVSFSFGQHLEHLHHLAQVQVGLFEIQKMWDFFWRQDRSGAYNKFSENEALGKNGIKLHDIEERIWYSKILSQFWQHHIFHHLVFSGMCLSFSS